MTYTADNLNITNGKLQMCPELKDLIVDITGQIPETDDPVLMVQYLKLEREKLDNPDNSTVGGQLNSIFSAELGAVQQGIEALIGGRTSSYLS